MGDRRDLIEEALMLYHQVFALNNEEDVKGKNYLHYGHHDVWITKIEKEMGKIYVENGKGFLVTYHRILDQQQSIISHHIWLAGVIPTARNEGIMKSLFCQATKEMDPSLPLVTIRTGPKFSQMENWIQRLGFLPRVAYEDSSTLYEILLSDLIGRLQSAR